VYRLNLRGDQGATLVQRPVAFAGRYLAYISAFDSPAGEGENIEVTVRDLVTGKVIHEAPGSESNVDSSYPVNVIVMNRKGWVAWTSFDRVGGGPDDGRPEHQLHTLTTGRRARLVDRGPKLAAGSLRLSRTGRTIVWRSAGVLHRYRLR
jgi:hypothetical protein